MVKKLSEYFLIIIILTLSYAIVLNVAGIFEKPKEIVVTKTKVVIIPKVDTVIVPKTINVITKVKDTVIIESEENDTSYYSEALFNTKFEKILIGAYAKASVDSFRFENFPKPINLTDTIKVTVPSKITLKEKIKWASVGVVGALLIRAALIK